MKQKSYSRGIFYLLIFLSAITGAAVLKITAPVILPVLFSIMLTFALVPLVRRMNRKLRIPWNVASTIIVILALILIYNIGSFLVQTLNILVKRIPDYFKQLAMIYAAIAKRLHIPLNDSISPVDNFLIQLGGTSTVQRIILRSTATLMGYSKNIILVVFLIVFLMAEIHQFREKVEAAFQGKVKGRVIHAVKNIVLQITRYISLKFIISLLTGIYVTIGTAIIGLEYPVLWGAISFVLNFIPYFGSAISIILTTLYSLLQFYPDLQSFVIVGLVMVSANILMGNLIEPKLMGTNLGLSPFIILICLSFWSWIWGFTGMLLAVPTTVILKIICENVSFLHPVAIFLGGKVQDTTKEFSTSETDFEEFDTDAADDL